MTLAAVPVATTTPAPRLAVVSEKPLVVSGTGFVRGERVRLTVATGEGARFVLVTARLGRFRVALKLAEQPCGDARFVRARGSRGSTALLRLEPRPCVPPPRD